VYMFVCVCVSCIFNLDIGGSGGARHTIRETWYQATNKQRQPPSGHTHCAIVRGGFVAN
jgi:hypothetical protein